MDIRWIRHGINATTQLIMPHQDEEIMSNDTGTIVDDTAEYLVDESTHVVAPTTEAEIEQIAAENLIFMAHDGQVVTEIISASTDENGTMVVAASDGSAIDCAAVLQQVAVDGISHEHEDAGGGDIIGITYTADYSETTPQMVTEEVITDDWVQHQGEERVEIPAEQIIGSSSQVLMDIEVPLPTVQDEYTALRPYPCDFCSRRFRKKASLMNHMVAHQNDRPHLCKLCGSRFFRRSDLINHLKAHANAPDPELDDAEFIGFVNQEAQPLHQPSRAVGDHYYDQDWSINTDSLPATSARTSRKSLSVSGNSSSTSSNIATAPVLATTATRGRISRLKPKKDESFIIEETDSLQQLQLEQQQEQPLERIANVVTMDLDYGECQELQASTAAVKLSQDHSPAHRKHYPIIDDSKPFVCQQCGLAFAREKALFSHVKNHRNDSPYECQQCNEMFWDTTSLHDHLKTHHFDESNSEYDPNEADDTPSESESDRLTGDFYCSECGVYFHRQDLLRRHAKSHLKNSSTNSDEVDNSKDQHCCNTCGETFAEALDLLAHAEIHARYPPFKCVLCGESFFEEPTIKNHLQRMHASDMTINSCILCGKECRDRKALIKHAWDHSREKCHSCSKCGKNFHNKARLKRHMASHRDKSVICDVCQEEFPDGRTLSNHRHSHSATSSGKLFPCHECGKTFGSRSSQQIHVRIHTGERPYGCRFCWKAFADGGTLRKHERIHTGEKPYACSVCPRAFNQRVVLREHIRSHHSGLDAKRGTYHCTVCSADLTSSNDLIQHLIQHSDMNTAMQRQPITGPRKYKRRRKLKPHEIERLRNEYKQNGNGSDIDLSDFDIDAVELLGIGDTTATNTTTAANTNTTQTSGNTKRHSKTAATKGNNTHHNDNSSNSATNAVKNKAKKRSTDNDEEDEDKAVVQKKKRYNSTSSNSDKLWQTKLINSNSNDDTYKSLLSNLENTLLSIDTLVVGNNSDVVINSSSAGGGGGGGGENRKQKSKKNDLLDSGSTAQRVELTTTMTSPSSASNKTRKKSEKAAKNARPRMIHTEKWRATNADCGSKRRSKTSVTRTDASNLDLLTKSSTVLVDDYEIISPDLRPPNQISSSPLHIKQEQREHQQHQHKQHNSNIMRDDAFYNAQLLLEASALRKETYEKYNPSIVNDLEEILRSPIKSDRSEQRRRFTSESSTQFIVEQTEAEQHLIKIEPTSPDLREIVSGASTSASAGATIASGAETIESPTRRSTRSTRSSRMVTANRKYLEFETDDQTTTTTTTTSISASPALKRYANNASKTKMNKVQHKRACLQTPVKSYLDYDLVDSLVSTPSTASNVNVTNTAAANAVAGVVTSTAQEQQRKQRYFECEMCSAIFSDRAQLLDHVPIHI